LSPLLEDVLLVVPAVLALWAAVSWAAATATTPVRPTAPAIMPWLTRLTRRWALRRRLMGEGVMATSLGPAWKSAVKRPSGQRKTYDVGRAPSTDRRAHVEIDPA
jgi:hypothetical protein